MRFTIPGELTDLNTYINQERSNRYAAANIKFENTTICSFSIGLRPPVCKDRVVICFKWYCRNEKKDPDNIAFAKKFICDALVITGVLKNDGWKQIAGFKDEFYIDKKNPRVEVELKEATDAV